MKIKPEIFRKIPWGIIAGSCAIVVFFATVAFIVIYMAASGVAAQTSESVSLFEYGYQTLIFVLDIICFVGFVGSLTMWILNKTGIFPRAEKEIRK